MPPPPPSLHTRRSTHNHTPLQSHAPPLERQRRPLSSGGQCWALRPQLCLLRQQAWHSEMLQGLRPAQVSAGALGGVRCCRVARRPHVWVGSGGCVLPGTCLRYCRPALLLPLTQSIRCRSKHLAPSRPDLSCTWKPPGHRTWFMSLVHWGQNRRGTGATAARPRPAGTTVAAQGRGGTPRTRWGLPRRQTLSRSCGTCCGGATWQRCEGGGEHHICKVLWNRSCWNGMEMHCCAHGF